MTLSNGTPPVRRPDRRARLEALRHQGLAWPRARPSLPCPLHMPSQILRVKGIRLPPCACHRRFSVWHKTGRRENDATACGCFKALSFLAFEEDARDKIKAEEGLVDYRPGPAGVFTRPSHSPQQIGFFTAFSCGRRVWRVRNDPCRRCVCMAPGSGDLELAADPAAVPAAQDQGRARPGNRDVVFIPAALLCSTMDNP